METSNDFYSLNSGEPERLRDCEWHSLQCSMRHHSQPTSDLSARLRRSSKPGPKFCYSLFRHEYGRHWAENKLFNDLSKMTAPRSQRLAAVKDAAMLSVFPATHTALSLLHPHECKHVQQTASLVWWEWCHCLEVSLLLSSSDSYKYCKLMEVAHFKTARNVTGS